MNMNKYVHVIMKCICSAEHRCLHIRIWDRRLKTELCKKFEKLVCFLAQSIGNYFSTGPLGHTVILIIENLGLFRVYEVP